MNSLDTLRHFLALMFLQIGQIPPTLVCLAISIKVIFKIMDKKTLIRLATPASIFALAVSIICLPIITKAEFYNGADVYVTHMNSCS